MTVETAAAAAAAGGHIIKLYIPKTVKLSYLHNACAAH